LGAPALVQLPHLLLVSVRNKMFVFYMKLNWTWWTSREASLRRPL
jgi:hypothetical protein